MESGSPIVTGISPKEGPPGTRVILRGENFGQSASDLISVNICGCDCTLSAEWKSPNKIVARSGPDKGKGDIIVQTRYGGVGTSTVQFRAYHETIGPTKESAVWVEEAPIHTLAWSRRSLSPASYQQEDPLGLSVEGNENKLPEDDLNDLFPNGSGDLASENFRAGRFLLEHHHATNFDDLKAGLSFLKRKVDSQKEGQLSFLKSNIGSVIDQLDMLAKLREKIEQDKGGIAFTEKLEIKIQISKGEAHKLFEEVLARRERADATRNALGVLFRFKFLFCLPSAIDKNVQAGDFDLVINDYARVKNLFGNKDIPVFKKVLIEIESRINQVRDVLLRKLKEIPPFVEDHIRIIRNLIHLETTGDPAWTGIECYAKYLITTMNDLKDKFIVLESSESTKRSKSISKMNYSDVQGNRPARILYVENLIALVEVKFPDLWKLGQMYFSGELHITPDPGKHKPYKCIVMDIIERFCNFLRAAILPHTLPRNNHNRHAYGTWSNSGMESIILWLPHCLGYVRVCHSSLLRIDLPSDALDIFTKLIFDLRFHRVATLFRAAAESIEQLYRSESWAVDINETYGGITDLPVKFETSFREVIQVIHGSVLLGEGREMLLLDDPNTKKEMLSLIFQSFKSFAAILEKLAFSNAEDNCERLTVISQLVYSSDVIKFSVPDSISWAQRLLAVMCNCHYTAEAVVPNLMKLMTSQNYPLTHEFISSCKEPFIVLSHRILEQYNEQKCDPLVGTIEPSMYVPAFDWDTSFQPTDIRPYAKEIVMNLIGVRSELYRVPLNVVEKIMCRIVDTIAEELARLMSCVKVFSLAGCIQARADILAVREATRSYTSKKALRFYEESLESIPPVEEEGEKIVQKIVAQSINCMNLQISSLDGA